MRVYAGTSALVAAGALLKAFHQRPNFYSATVYLSQSNACILILTNLALVCACSFIYSLQRIFYGPLRQIEIEQLTEKAWYAVLDTLLAMPSLSHDVSGWMLAIFVLLLAGKVWGWIGEGRVDILEQQPPQNPRLFHARLSSSLIISVIFDLLMMYYCVNCVRDDPRPGMMVIFTFEFAILTIFSIFTLSRYVLALGEARITKLQTEQKIQERKLEIRAERARRQREHAEGPQPDAPLNLPSEDDIDENEIDVPGWEEKRRWLFALELGTGMCFTAFVTHNTHFSHFADFIKLVIYTIFFAISLTFMGLPMHIMRDVYLTFSAFAKRLKDYSNYRKATQNMNDRYSDATTEELSNNDTCIVCRETMTPYRAHNNAARPNESLRPKKLPCGHILHLRCLKAWLERQQTCPTCRRPVVGGQTPNASVPGQARIEGPNQPNPPGANANAAGNNPVAALGRQQQQRPNRLRMLNLGPIRIGLYNGPAHQLPDALENRRDTQNQPAGVGATSNGVLGNQSTQVQLMQVEERLMHDARQLAIEQTQLGTVRALEAELARLRALHDIPRQLPMERTPFGSVREAEAELARARALHDTLVPTIPAHIHMPEQAPFALPQLPQTLQPVPDQDPLGSGHASLPQGMTLPEGWTITPLNPVGGPLQNPSSFWNTTAPTATTASRSTTPGGPSVARTASAAPPSRSATATPTASTGPRSAPPSATTTTTTTVLTPETPQAPPPEAGLPDISAQIEAALTQALQPQIAALRPQVEAAIHRARSHQAALRAAAAASAANGGGGASTATQTTSQGGDDVDGTARAEDTAQITPASNGDGDHVSAPEAAAAAPSTAATTAEQASWGFSGVDQESDESGADDTSSSSEADERRAEVDGGERSGSLTERGRGKRRAVTLEDVEDDE